MRDFERKKKQIKKVKQEYMGGNGRSENKTIEAVRLNVLPVGT